MHDTSRHTLDEPAVLSMTWADLLFAHWAVDPPVVQAALPEGLTVDTHDGSAWLGVVPFVMEDIRPRFAPVGLSFGELNLRTYVHGPDGTPAIYFFNLDATDRLGVAIARALFKLPYYTAEMDIDRSGSTVDFESVRTHEGQPTLRFDGSYTPEGEPFQPTDGTLPYFLTERYRFYAESDRGRLYYGDVEHDPWLLSPATAEVRETNVFEANGFERPPSDPVFHYCRRIEVEAGRPHRE